MGRGGGGGGSGGGGGTVICGLDESVSVSLIYEVSLMCEVLQQCRIRSTIGCLFASEKEVYLYTVKETAV